MDAKSFRALVTRLEDDPTLLHNLVFEGATDPELQALLSGRTGAVQAGSVGALRQMLIPTRGRYASLLELAAASCDENVTCCCTSGTCSGVTCGGSTCSVTCSGDSCGNTCGDSCGMTTNFSARAALDRVSEPREAEQRSAWR
ncbi:MAG: hypothetical protein JWM84_290 [Nocardioides sp.]|jgi:hypothetical protein|nr:hypothetical protein [Nocardioides sp.]